MAATPPDMLPAVRGVAYARVHCGRWVVPCVRPWCASALTLPPGTPAMQCWDCGAVAARIVWPPDPDGIEAILLMRPNVLNRGWEPGETLEDLLIENVTHGILPTGIEPADPDAVACGLMTTMDDRIIGGLVGLQLTSDVRRHQIEATTRGGQ